MKSKNIIIVLTLLLAFSVMGYPSKVGAAKASNLNPGNVTYHGIAKKPITLKSGHWEGKPFVKGGASRPMIDLVKDFLVRGDLDGDGRAETVVFLTMNSGGSGVYYYLAILTDKNGKTVNVATKMVGDRIEVKNGEIKEGKIALHIIQQGPDDPSCCPSQKVLRSWRLEKGNLKELKPIIEGKLSLQDLKGVTWRLIRISRNGHSLFKRNVTLRFGDGTLEGEGLCGSFSATVRPDKEMPDGLHISRPKRSQSSCEKGDRTLEDRFFEALSGVESFGFYFGKLALNWQKGKRYGSLLFSPTTSSMK